MLTTAELIEGMTDEGKFEKLALAVLRRMKPADCAAVHHNGVNARGETIPRLIDAEGFVPGIKPPRYVMIQFTKTRRRELNRKWLFNHLTPDSSEKTSKRAKPLGPNDDGDLVKVIRRAKEIREQFPDASFKAYLVASSHGVGELEPPVRAAGEMAGVETEIMEAGLLADFLDHDPQGELILSKLLGPPVTHVSSEWLIEMGRKSLELRQSRPDFETATNIISRACCMDLRSALRAPRAALIWVVAPPGKGKSVVSVDAVSSHLNEGGFALWLSENDVRDSESLLQAVDSAVRRECRSLEPEAARKVLQSATRSTGLVLLLDDLNRLQDPEEAFRKVRSWARCASPAENNGKDRGSSGSSFVLVCPIWPQHLERLDSSSAITSGRPSWEQVFEVPNFTANEAAVILSGLDLSALEIQAIAQELGFDPLFCSLAAEKLRSDGTTIPIAAREIVFWHLDQQLKRVMDKTGRPTSEYLAAIHCLAEAMLRAKNLRPNWACVQTWIDDSETRSRLIELFGERAVIQCQARSETVLFNHDRFLDAMCAESIPPLLEDMDACRDPYFAEIIGRAIAEGRLTEAAIVQVLYVNPLAVFCGLMFATSDTLKQSLTPLLFRWAREQGQANDLPNQLLFEVALILLKTDSPAVVELAGQLPEIWGFDLAALRNGSANYGVNYCRSYERHAFMPGVRDSRRDAIIEHARAKHRVRLVGDLNRDLSQAGLPIEIQDACLILAGFLRDDELTAGIERCWKNCSAKERPEIVASAVWAIVRCAHERFAELLPLVFEVWQTIPDQGAKENDHPRSNLAFYALGHCSPRWMSEAVAQWLISVLPLYPGLRSSFDYLLGQADTPSAFEYQVRRLAANKREKGGDFSFYFMIERRWDPADKSGYRISELSYQRLHRIWSSTAEPAEDRECAFRFWILSATVSDLAILRSIKNDDPFYSLALRVRMKLSDLTAVAELPEALRRNSWLLFDVPPIWSPELHKTILEVFRAERESLRHRDDWVATFFLSLPENDAEALLSELWPEWGHELGFQVAALLLGTDIAKKLVNEALNEPKTCDEVLKSTELAIYSNWPYLNREEHLPRWLHCCAPHLHHASQETLRQFVHLCRSPLTWRWYEKYVRPLLKSESETDLDRRMKLESLEARYRSNRDSFYGAHDLFEEVEQRGLDKKEVLKGIADSARKAPTVDNVKWLAACIGVAGDRRDISLLQEEFAGVDAGVLAKARRDCAFAVMRRVLT